MASSTVCNCTRNIIQLATISFMLLLLTSASASEATKIQVTSAQSDDVTDVQDSTCGGGAIRNGSALKRNLKMVLNSLVENVNKTGYNISSYGENGDKMYGLAQCRGDLNASTCRACASEATKNLLASCGPSRYGWIILVGCFMRYDTLNFYSQLDLLGHGITGWCNGHQINGTAANGRSWEWNTASLLTAVTQNAISSNVGYSTGNDSGIYSLAQCWRDLNTSQCSQCLNIAYRNFSCPSGTIEGEAYNENCMLRLGREKFFGDGVPLLSPSTGSGPSRTTEGKGQPKIMGLIIGGAVISVSAVISVAVVVICKRKISKRGSKQQFLPVKVEVDQLRLKVEVDRRKVEFEVDRQ